MGAGSSLDATYPLQGNLPAGQWTIVGDGIVTASVDVSYDILLRHAGTDTTIVSWQHHFDPLGGGNFSAQPFDGAATGAAQSVVAGDLLVWRFTGTNSTAAMAFVPNGDGTLSHGRLPSIVLPP